jgi:hypothetical protein
MMSSTNPYAPPLDPSAAEPISEMSAEYAAVVGRLIGAMRRTQPWITLFAVLALVFGSLAALAGLSMLFLSMGRGRSGGALAQLGPWIMIVYLVFAAIYLVIGKLLWSYRTSIVGFIRTEGNPGLLASAVEKQASFWKFCGVIATITLVLYIPLVAFTITRAASTVEPPPTGPTRLP